MDCSCRECGQLSEKRTVNDVLNHNIYGISIDGWWSSIKIIKCVCLCNQTMDCFSKWIKYLRNFGWCNMMMNVWQCRKVNRMCNLMYIQSNTHTQLYTSSFIPLSKGEYTSIVVYWALIKFSFERKTFIVRCSLFTFHFQKWTNLAKVHFCECLHLTVFHHTNRITFSTLVIW